MTLAQEVVLEVGEKDCVAEALPVTLTVGVALCVGLLVGVPPAA